MEKGQLLASRCSEFDYAVQNLTQAASVPTIPVTGARFVSVLSQSCTQSPQALWSAVGRQERLWGTGILFKFFDLQHYNSLHCFTTDVLR